MRISFLFLLLFLSQTTFAQLYFNRYDSVQVTEENGPLSFPWAGGMNHAQFSNMDFDADGRNDLFVFDKSGDKIICLRTNESNELELAPKYRHMFVDQHTPDQDRLHDWVILRDFNADGKTDIFAYSNGGMAVYRNDGNPDTLIFTLITKKLLSQYGNGLINIYVSPTDLPAIMDVNGDSDMDIVTFSLFGTSAEYHENQSMELYGIPDSMTMQLATSCWGNFEEDPSTVAVNLNVSCKGVTTPTEEMITEAYEGARHSGFTMLGLDIEGDGDQDLALANLSFNTMNILINDGDANSANIGSQDLTFPANFNSTVPVDIYTFPAAFLADVNNDGKTDIIGSPYQENNGHDYQGSYLYTNSASSGFDLTFQKNNFLQDEMIELGTSAYPVFFDYDNDGLKDLLVGNKGYFVSTGTYSSQLAYYRNTGTATEPAFTLQTRNVANISQLGLGNVAPTFGDIDGDGDDDMIIGDAAGLIHYFENSAGTGNPCSFTLTTPGFQGIDITGQFATPCLYDVDGDELLDLVIGERNGNLNMYYNEGTATNPNFVLSEVKWGGVDMKRNGLSFGYSTPFLFEYDGTLQMLVGSESGVIDLYDQITEVISGPAEVEGEIGSGTAVSTSNETTPFGFSTASGRNQYLIRADELTAQGLVQGVIEKLALTTANGPSVTHAQFYVKMGLTDLDELNGFVDGFSSVYFVSSGTVPQGTVEYLAQTPIIWDGTSNLIIEFCWFQTNSAGTGFDLNVEYSTTSFNSNAYSSAGNFSGCGIVYQGSNNERPNFKITIKPSFNKIAEFPVYEGERSAPCVVDLNADALPEVVIGNLAGGLAYYKGDTVGLTISGIEEADRMQRFDLNLYPNPNNGNFTIEPHFALAGTVQMNVYNMMGEVAWTGKSQNLIRESIDLSQLQSGIYLLDIRSESKMATKRFIIQR
ncbi:MAG: T9SS type A sorting domain-containing protein [Flavobacteriales bacterium]|nr:T9SS type A sorting domain-containing protein [Flavobacteriales bacterium]